MTGKITFSLYDNNVTANSHETIRQVAKREFRSDIFLKARNSAVLKVCSILKNVGATLPIASKLWTNENVC